MTQQSFSSTISQDIHSQICLFLLWVLICHKTSSQTSCLHNVQFGKMLTVKLFSFFFSQNSWIPHQCSGPTAGTPLCIGFMANDYLDDTSLKHLLSQVAQHRQRQGVRPAGALFVHEHPGPGHDWPAAAPPQLQHGQDVRQDQDLQGHRRLPVHGEQLRPLHTLRHGNSNQGRERCN